MKMIYKGYEAVVEYDEEAMILHGEMLHLQDVITFQADNPADIEQAFHDSVDDYLDFCKQHHRLPEKPYSGKVAVRMSPELHREVTYAARMKKESVNSFIVQALEAYTNKL
jgi:predicted HicB family RNase H-like nuclease